MQKECEAAAKVEEEATVHVQVEVHPHAVSSVEQFEQKYSGADGAEKQQASMKQFVTAIPDTQKGAENRVAAAALAAAATKSSLLKQSFTGYRRLDQSIDALNLPTTNPKALQSKVDTKAEHFVGKNQ